MTIESIRSPFADEVSDEVPEVVRVRDASKRFVVRRDNSLKERIVTLGRAGRRHSEDFWALRDVDLSIPAGSTVGLLGSNGSGKSTLLKLIGGIIEPTTGEVVRRGRLAALIELGAGFHPDLTGRENVFLNAAILGLTPSEATERFDDILAFSGIGDFVDTQVKFYSSGMYVRLAFAVAVHTDPDVLLVDEVLAVGDEQFQRKCLDKIRQFQQEGRTIILVSHALNQVQELCDSAVVLDHGHVKFVGPAREAVQEFREIMEEHRLEDIAATPEEEPTARADVVVESVTVAPRSGGDGVAVWRDDIDITVEVSAKLPVDGWTTSVAIENTAGHLAFGTDTRLLGVELPRLDGTASVRLTLEDVRFGPGPYFVHVEITTPDGRQLAVRRDAARFSMVDDARWTGLHAIATYVDVAAD